MKSLVSLRSLAAIAFVLGSVATASAAHARNDIQFSIGIQSPGVYVQPAPVYVQPRPVYVQPRPVYVQPSPVYVQPRPVFVQRHGPYGDRDRDGVPNIHDRDNRNGRHHHGRPDARADRDRDGVPNRYDRFPGNPYYR